MVTPPSSPWRWPWLSFRPALLALALLMANALWRALTVNLDLRASGFGTLLLKPLVWELSSALMVWLLLPMIQAVTLNAPWNSARLGRFLALHGMGCLVFWVFHVAGMWMLRLWIYHLAGWGAYHYGETLPRLAMEGLKDILSFGMLALCFHLFEARRARQAWAIAAAHLETELREARLQALSAQLDPHFLFNALNTLSALMYEDLAKADRLFAALGQMLRDGLGSEAATWPLNRELAHLDNYLSFSEVRFGDRLQVEQRIDPGLGQVAIPRFSLQRLLENAIKHNSDTVGKVLHVRVEARQEQGRAAFRVLDDGCGFQGQIQTGLGLNNLRHTLALLHGASCTLETGSTPEGGAWVAFQLPLEASHD